MIPDVFAEEFGILEDVLETLAVGAERAHVLVTAVAIDVRPVEVASPIVRASEVFLAVVEPGVTLRSA